MRTPEQRLAFAVDFAAVELDGLREGDRLNLGEELLAFVRPTSLDDPGAGVRFVCYPTHYKPHRFDDSLVRGLQQAVRQLLRGMVSTRDWRPGDEGATAPLERFPIHVNTSIAAYSQRAPWVVFEGPMRDAFLLTLGLLLSEVGTERIRACPECDRIFLRVRRQLYCSDRCTNTAGFKRYVRKHGGDEAVREKRAADERRRYVDRKVASAGEARARRKR